MCSSLERNEHQYHTHTRKLYTYCFVNFCIYTYINTRFHNFCTAPAACRIPQEFLFFHFRILLFFFFTYTYVRTFELAELRGSLDLHLHWGRCLGGPVIGNLNGRYGECYPIGISYSWFTCNNSMAITLDFGLHSRNIDGNTLYKTRGRFTTIGVSSMQLGV